MAKAILHLDGLKRYFDVLQQTSPERLSAARKEHFDPLKALLSNAAFSLVEASEVLEKLNVLGWTGAEKAELAGLVRTSLPEQVSVGNAARRGLQDYTNLHLYLKQDMWDYLASGASFESKVGVVIEHAVNLGLRCPSEPTVQRVLALSIMSDAARSLQPGVLHELFKNVKSRLKASCSKGPRNEYPHILQLPADWKDLSEEWRSLALQNEAPAPCAISRGELASLSSKIPLRSTNSAVSSRASFLTPYGHAVPPFDPQACVAYMMQQFLPHCKPPVETPLRISFQPRNSRSFSQPLQLTQGPQHDGYMGTAVNREQSDRFDASNVASQHDSQHLAETQQPMQPMPADAADARADAADARADACSHGQMQPMPEQPAQVQSLSRKHDVLTATALIVEAMGNKHAEQVCKKPAGNCKVVKAPALKQKRAQAKAKSSTTVAELPSKKRSLQLAPHGCSKCRNKPGCTPSCWKGRKWT